MAKNQGIFVWRNEQLVDQIDTVYYQIHDCTWCSGMLTSAPNDESSWTKPKSATPKANWNQDWSYICPFCGWTMRQLTIVDDDYPYRGKTYLFNAEMRHFALDNKELLLSEIGTHLKRRFSDLYLLSPRRFEELVADLFKQLGYRSVLTPTTGDRGIDVYLLGKTDEDMAIVEVKRYAKNRKVGIGVVDRLRGVQLRDEVPNAYIVTSGSFTTLARKSAASKNAIEHGYNLTLVDADRFLKILGVYNTLLPPLDVVMKGR